MSSNKHCTKFKQHIYVTFTLIYELYSLHDREGRETIFILLFQILLLTGQHCKCCAVFSCIWGYIYIIVFANFFRKWVLWPNIIFYTTHTFCTKHILFTTGKSSATASDVEKRGASLLAFAYPEKLCHLFLGFPPLMHLVPIFKKNGKRKSANICSTTPLWWCGCLKCIFQ